MLVRLLISDSHDIRHLALDLLNLILLDDVTHHAQVREAADPSPGEHIPEKNQ